MAKGRRRVSAVGLSVAELLNEAQRGAASAHVRYSKMLWELAHRNAEDVLAKLLVAVKWFATVAEVWAAGGRCVPAVLLGSDCVPRRSMQKMHCTYP